MSWFDSAFEEGGFTGGRGGYGYVPDGGYGDINPEGAESDPFGYTKGSLLTPWEGHFAAPPGSGGGYSTPEFIPFNYADFKYDWRAPAAFDERYVTPEKFTYQAFEAPGPFKAPDEEAMKRDPGYLARVQAGQKALLAEKALGGTLRTGGTAKALSDYNQQAASNEYGNVYNRSASEYDRRFANAKDVYGLQRGNAAENFDRNVRNALDAYRTRLDTYKTNADVSLQGGRLGYDITQGTWDRNFQKARQGWEDAASARAAAASAGNASRDRDYERALNEYKMSRDEFWTNQDRQYNILDREATRGFDASDRYGRGATDLITGGANARAAGRVGSGNAWSGAFGNIGSYAGDAALYGGGFGGGGYRRPTRGGGGGSGRSYLGYGSGYGGGF